MKKVYLVALWILAFFIVIPSFGQISRKDIARNNRNMREWRGRKQAFTKQKRYQYFGISLNSMHYFGDITPSQGFASSKFTFIRPGISVVYGHRFGPRYTVQGSLSYGRLQSDDFAVADPQGENSRFRYVRNAHFRNDIIELAAVTIFDLYKNEDQYLDRQDWTPYAFIGIAGFHHNPKAIAPDAFIQNGNALPEAGQWVDLQPLGTEGQNANLLERDANFGNKPYSLWQVSIPFGLGVRFAVGEALDFSVDFSVRYLFTDYIDDVSQNYVDLGVLDGDLAKAMSDRSREPVAAKNGEARDISGWTTITYIGRDGQTYEVINGFGSEQPTNKRGGKEDNDMFFTTRFTLSYIIGASFRRAKFR